MDAALQAHLRSMQNMGGEHPGHGILGLAIFKDTPGFSKAQGLEDLMRMLFSANAHGLSGGAGKAGGFGDKILNFLKQIFEQLKGAGGTGISGGAGFDGPTTSGLDTSHNSFGHSGAGISYD